MSSLIDFISFKDAGVFTILIGAITVSISSALIGTFTFLRKKALVGDAVSHSVLPGICLAFLISGEKDPVLMVLGAFLSGWISVFFIDFIVSRSKIKADSAISITLSFFFALGAVMLSYIQNSGNANQSGINHFLFGKAAAITDADFRVFLYVFGIILLFTLIYFKKFVTVCFNEDYAKSIGWNVKWIDFVMSSLTVLVIASGIQTVGVVLMAALLITPPGAAAFWTHNIKKMIVLGLVISVLSSFMGTYVSYIRPNMPTGPWIVFFLSLVAIFSVLFSPKGILKRFWNNRKNKRKIRNENLLKTAYKLTFEKKLNTFTRKDIITRRDYETSSMEKGLNVLKTRGLIQETNEGLQLTQQGIEESKRIVRLHRLWELYLTNKMNFKSDHIHGMAETIEHIITPEIEAKLIAELDFPEKDPHDSIIPS
ncbi:MAG: iron chelate uptake ABC transporter family permease subunit [Crocinitomicaceae bacterium]